MPAKYKKGHSNMWLPGQNHPHWKGGITMSPSGYVLIKNPKHPHAHSDGYMRLHRLVYETYNKCCLLPYTIIHHINGVKTDNRIENLQIMSDSEHMRYHRLHPEHM